MKRRILGLILALAMVLGMVPAAAFADSAADPITVYLTVSNRGVLAQDKDGEPMACREVLVADLDESGDFTVDEALQAAHAAYFGEDGYATGTYGVTMLWGVETSNVLTFVNHAGISTGVMVDKVNAEDLVVVSVNADDVYYADWYSSFDAFEAAFEAGTEVDFTLTGHLGMAYTDEDKADVPLAGITVKTADGRELGVTDEDGRVYVSFEEEGDYILTAEGSVEDVVTDWNLMDLGGDPSVYGTMDFQTYESYIAYTAKDYGDGPYPADEVLYMDFFEWNELDESEQEGIFPLHTNQILADCPIIAPACRITVGELPEQPETVLASVRIVGPNNEDFIPYVRMGIEKGATLRELTNEVLALYGASASWNDWGFLNAINGCDIGEDYWMSMLNDSGDAFNTGTFDSITAEDGDVLVLYPYGNGNYAWLNAEEAAPVSVMDWEGTEYITGSASFTLSANSYDDNWNTVTAPLAGATVTVCEEGGEPIPQDAYKSSLVTLETDESGAFAIDFYGNCPAEDLEYYSYTYWLYAEKDGYNKAFCEVSLTADGLTFSQPAPAETPDEPDEPGKKDVDIDALMAGIAATYTETTTEWAAMDMGAYELQKPDAESKLSDAAKQTLVNNAAAKAAEEGAADTDIAKFILALQANGYDPQAVYAPNSNDPQDMVAVLSKTQLSPNAWNAPYSLAAFAQGDYGELPAKDALLSAVLNAQAEDGSWEAWGATVDATANVLPGLAFYQGEPGVAEAIEKGVEYLASMQKDDGSFDAWGYGADANTQAIVVIGLAAAGVDPAADERFVKGGISALDVLLNYSLDDNTGFGYQDDETLNASATEQGFRALLAVAGGLRNVYDYSGVSPLEPAKASGSGTPVEPDDPTGDDIRVSVTIKADTGYWLENYSAKIPGDGATAYHAMVKALDDNNIEYKSKNGGYIYTLTYNGRSLGEFDAGPKSGWLYKVNGVLPTVGLAEYGVKTGDKITFYFTEDWTKDPDAASNAGLSEPAKTEEKSIFIDVKQDAWYAPYAAKAAELDLMTGYAAGTAEDGTKQYEFRAGETVTRAQFAQILYSMAGSPDIEADSTAWYAKAVAWAVNRGVMAGYYDGLMHEEDPITREQMAVMIYAYARSILKAGDAPDLTVLDRFADTPAPDEYAKEALAWMLTNGLLAGRGANRGIVVLAAHENTTRAEIAAIAVALEAFLK